MARKQWIFKPMDKVLAKELAEECDIDPMVALLLSSRGLCDPYDIDVFVKGDTQLADPWELPDMEAAVDRIRQAIECQEKIAVCGDYDADGVTAAALLYTYLQGKNCEVICDIPERLEEGYGLHTATIDRLHEKEVTLIITVDNGISAVEEIAYASSLGIDVVVTDHHRPGDVLPNAVAVVDPHIGMPPDCFADYAGVGVAFKLICGLEECPCEYLLEEYGDLVAIGTIADVVPLLEENRLFVQHGLAVLNRLERIGIQALVAAADIAANTITADQVAFGLAPRINAAGRMGKSIRAFRLLTTADPQVAEALAHEICCENVNRQSTEADVSNLCIANHIQSGIHFYDRVIVMAGHGWHQGVLGIVAARLCGKFGKPAIILSIDGNQAKGSARSLEGFDLFQALSACSDHLKQWGGHTLAAGLTLETNQIEAFRQAINNYAKALGNRPLPKLSIDCKLSPLGASENTAFAIRCLAPHGCQNPVPTFALMNMELNGLQPVGNGRSLRLSFARDAMTVTCMKFGITVEEFGYRIGDKVDLAVVFRYGTYKNRPTYTVVIQDIRPHDMQEEVLLHHQLLFERFMAGEFLQNDEKLLLLPSREELVAVYRYIRTNPVLKVTPDVLWMRLNFSIEPGKLMTSLAVFEEFGFIRLEYDGDYWQIEFISPQGKFDLSTSKILLKLQA